MHRLRLCSLVTVLALASCSKSDSTQSAQPPSSSAQPSQPAQPTEPQAAAPSKDPAAARKLISEGAAVIDVRTADEYGEGHVASAQNIPIDDFSARLAEVDKLVSGDKSKPVVVYCAAGKRAAKAKQQLEAAGYTHVINGGGFDDLQ